MSSPRGLRRIVSSSERDIPGSGSRSSQDPSSCHCLRRCIRRKYALASERRARPRPYLLAADWPAAPYTGGAPPLRAAVKFSTLQSYEFVAVNAITTYRHHRHIAAPAFSASAVASYSFPMSYSSFSFSSFSFSSIYIPLFPAHALRRGARRRLTTTLRFMTRDILYPKYYAQSSKRRRGPGPLLVSAGRPFAT